MIGPNKSMTAPTHPFSFTCEEPGCFWITGHKTEEDAERVRDKHLEESCPLVASRKIKMDMSTVDDKGQLYPSMTKTPIEECWDHMDELIWKIKEDEKANELDRLDPDVIEQMKGKCRGIAYVISRMYPSTYSDEVKVLQQAQKRWRIRKGEIAFEPTPMYHHAPLSSALAVPSGQINTALDRYNKQTRRRTTSSKTTPAKGQLPADKVADVKKAMQSGVFTAEKLASIYHVTEAEITRVVALP